MVHTLPPHLMGKGPSSPPTNNSGFPIPPANYSGSPDGNSQPTGLPVSGASSGNSKPLINWADIPQSNPLVLAGIVLVVIILIAMVLT